MGVVYRGFDPKIGRDVAIKIIRLDQSAAADKRADLNLWFAREAAVAGKLSHPNIVTVHDFGEQDDIQYLVLELVDGHSLETILPNGHAFDGEMAVAVLSQVAGALDYAHGEGIVHRDVKPANILVCPDGKVRCGGSGIEPGGTIRVLAASATRSCVGPGQRDSERVTSSAGSAIYTWIALGSWLAYA